MIRRDLSAAIAAHVRLHERTCQLEDEHHRGIHRARQALARTRSVDAFQRWRTAACHGSGLHGPVDASSVGLRCISESAAAELLNRDGFSSCRLCLFARQAANARCRSDSCSVKSTSSPFGPGRKNSSNLAPRARRARAATSCFRIVPR